MPFVFNPFTKKLDITVDSSNPEGPVSGPATSVVGNIATWNDTTGTLLADGGIAPGTFLQKANNLSDLTNTTTARSNLGLGSAALLTDPITETHGGTAQTTYAQGDLLYASAANTLSKLAKSATATRYLANTGTSNNPAWAQVNLANGVTGTLPLANGGLNTTAITGIVAGSGSAYAGRTITGTANQVSVANGNGASANPTLSLPSTIYTNISFDSGSNTLNAYATGTWTPTVTSDATPPTVTYGVQRGTYVKIGRFCYVSCLITFATYTGGNGHLQIAGLPFAAQGDLNFPVGAAQLQNVAYLNSYTAAQLQDVGGSQFIQFIQGGPSTSNGNADASVFSASSIINFSLCYRTT